MKTHRRRHTVKSANHRALLLAEWKKDSHFTPERIKALANTTGLAQRCIYKWVWDRNKGYRA